MPLAIPAAANYPSPLVAVPSLMQDEPDEGRKQVPCEILWVTMGGAGLTVAFNLQGNATLQLTQISALKVDQSASAADVQFIFPDTGDTITVPAGSPLVVVPVYSNSLQFYVSAPNAKLGDVTRFQLLNYRQYPADVPATSERQVASSGGTVVNQATNTTLQLIPTNVNGTLQDLQIWLSQPTNPAVAPVLFSFSVQDGAATPSVLINQFGFDLVAGTFSKLDIVNISRANWRFQKGVAIPWQGFSGTGGALLNMFANYTKP